MEALGSARGAVDSLLGTLGSVIVDEARLLGGVRGEVQFIKDEMESMNGFLLLVDEASEDVDHQVRAWTRQVRDVAVDSERWVGRFQRWAGAAPHGDGPLGFLRRILYSMSTVRERRVIATKVQELKARAQEVGDRRQRYGVEAPKSKLKLMQYSQASLLGDNAEEQEFLRRRCLEDPKEPKFTEEEKFDLIWWLTADDIGHLKVLQVVGACDSGMPRLKSEVFENKVVDERFDLNLWVSVPPENEGRIERIVQQLLSDLERRRGKTFQGRTRRRGKTFQGRTEKDIGWFLKGERFLIVWEGINDPTTFAVLHELLTNCSKTVRGNAMVVITQDPSCPVSSAYIVDKSPEIFNSYLDKAIELVRMGTGKAYFEELRETLRSIMEKLAPDYFYVKMMVHMIYVKPDRSKEELEGLRRELSSGKGPKTRNMLRFCYDDLPANYRRCLLYLTIFPPGRKISRTSLVRRWVAEGLVISRTGLNALDAAECCFGAIFDRGLLRVEARGTDGNVKRFTVPEQVLDFIAETARADNLADTTNLPPGLAAYLSIGNGISSLKGVPKRRNICPKILRSICSSKHSDVPAPAREHSDIHAPEEHGIIQAPESDPSRDIVALLGSLPALERQGLLKVLDLEGCTALLKHHLKIICQIPELRYLSLRSTNVYELPKEIYRLHNLETLDIRETKVTMLPAKTFLLQKLKHLLSGSKQSAGVMGSNGLFTAVDLPLGIGSMTEMQVLSHVKVPDDSDKLIDDFARLQKLRKLGLVLREQREPHHQHLLNLLRAIEKLNRHLRSLSIQIELTTDGHQANYGPATRMITLPVCLESIKISGFGMGLPSCMLKLNQIVKITLQKSSLRDSDIRTLGKLARLRHLRIGYIDLCEQADLAGKLVLKKFEFTNLKSLYLEYCINVKLSIEVGAASKLESIVIWTDSNLVIDSVSGIDHLTRLNRFDIFRGKNRVKQAPLQKKATKATNALEKQAQGSKGKQAIVTEELFEDSDAQACIHSPPLPKQSSMRESFGPPKIQSVGEMKPGTSKVAEGSPGRQASQKEIEDFYVDDLPKYQHGNPLLPSQVLEEKPWEMRKFQEWYLKACDKGLEAIKAVVPYEVFNCPSFELHLMFEESYLLYNLRRVDITIMTLWCLLSDTTDEKKRIGYLNPAIISRSALNPRLNKDEEKYKNLSAEVMKEIEKKIRDKSRSNAVTYIGQCMCEWSHKDCIIAPYNFNDHWIAILIHPNKRKVWVFDSLDKKFEEYKDFIDILNCAYRFYVEQMKGEHNPECTNEMHVLTHYPCAKQVRGTLHCGYYVCHYISSIIGNVESLFNYVPPEDPGHQPQEQNCHLSEAQLYEIVNKMVCFITDHFINSQSKFFYKNGEMAKHKDLVDWTGEEHDTIGIIGKPDEEEQKKNDEKDRSPPQDEDRESCDKSE